MLFAVVCSFGIAGCVSPTVPPAGSTTRAIVPPGSRVLPGPWGGRLLPRGFSLREPIPEPEKMRREMLEQTRRLRRLLEDEIEMYERMAAEADASTDPARYPPSVVEASRDIARDCRQTAAKFRKALPEVKQRERELWEEQPGGIEAPPPREVKK
jgi:hypothetical protein